MKTVVVTGATSGIGLAVCRALLARGYRVIGVGRVLERCDAARKSLMTDFKDADMTYVVGDLSRQGDVNRVAEEIMGQLDGDGLFALINNAGGVRSWYETTPEGFEFQFALNYLAGFLLTYRLMPHLKKAAGRVIFTGSGSHRYMTMHWRDIMYQKRYSCLMAYKQSKLAQMLFAAELNRRFASRGLNAYVVDPGLVCTDIGTKDTTGIVSRFWALRRKKGELPSVPAETYAYLCDAPHPDGFYYYLCRPRKYSRHADDVSAAQRLFALSEQLCGIKFEE
jgi:NAD(P)-dependent dehydrogenase (short-subunit alcohol dehydrogenase family)